jgi:hypothetical protein
MEDKEPVEAGGADRGAEAGEAVGEFVGGEVVFGHWGLRLD